MRNFELSKLDDTVADWGTDYVGPRLFPANLVQVEVTLPGKLGR